MDYSERFLARQRRGMQFGRAVSIRASQLKKNDLPPGLREAWRPPPEFFKQARALSERARVLAAAFKLNSADLAVDRYLRSFLAEFNSRVLRGEGNQMPQSFNVLGSFVDPDETTLILRLLEERPYIASLDAILDHMTDPARIDPPNLINELDELVIYEINILGGFSDFAIPGQDTMACCGVAFVREHDELAIMGVFGQRVETLRSTRMTVHESEITPGKEFLLDGQEDIDASDHPLFGRKDYTPVILMTRVSLPDRKVLVRYAFQEKTDMFLVHTDDAELLEELAEREDGADRIQAQLEGVEQYAELFRLIVAMPEFLTALEAHDDLVVERHPTKLKTDRAETAIRKVVEALKPSERINFVNVKALYAGSLAANTYVTRPPDFHIEQSGHWKRLDFGEEGADRQGRAVQGKTWVTKQTSWRQSAAASAASGPIDVAVGVGNDAEEAVGEIYVMRSGAHPKDWYKIGFTRKTSDDRAGGLSATSGQPDHFNVIQSWRVREPRLVEHRVHGRLAAFRTNAGREFFCLKYSQIRECIETAIDEMGALIEEP